MGLRCLKKYVTEPAQCETHKRAPKELKTKEGPTGTP